MIVPGRLPRFLGTAGIFWFARYIMLDTTPFWVYLEDELSFHPFGEPGLLFGPGSLFFFLRRGIEQVPEKLVSGVSCKILEFFESLYNSSG